MAQGLTGRLAASLFALLALGGEAMAHPHVWVSGQSQIVFGADSGAITAVRHSWTFDEFFSTMATQGLDADGDGKLSREELDELAQVNVESLAEYGFFTFLGDDKAQAVFNEPVDYWLVHEDGQLTLHFTLPLAEPLGSGAGLRELAVYDPSYFVAFSFAENDPVSVVDTPPGCSAQVKRNATPLDAPERFVPDALMEQLGDAANFGESFAERVEISCQ